MPVDAHEAGVAVGLHGAGGRMGLALLAQAAASGDPVVAAWTGGRTGRLGQPAGPDWPALALTRLGEGGRPSVVIDFSHAQAFDPMLAWCVDRAVALVSGTTGLDERQVAAMDRAAQSIPVLWAANFSLGIVVLERLVREAAARLPAWSASISEAHHAGKRDAPSGTALILARAIARARGRVLDEAAVRADPGRGDAGIGFAVIRAGDIVGDHQVVLAGPGERIELGHRAGDRAVFARGALHAARWLVGQPPGRYELADALPPRPES
ncbi:MAG: 4-hydroxy-tetrahydrodipicolinate reductase [Xanthomonadales bacterium]|nr:4-hydroxy-tetrahydrodipicolinate reductase [Xanthomonadales bacterium]